MRWTGLSQADRVVGENINRGDFHQRTKAHAWAHVVAEIKKSGAVAAEFRQSHAVDNRAHGMLANAEMHVAATVLVGKEISRADEYGGRNVHFGVREHAMGAIRSEEHTSELH